MKKYYVESKDDFVYEDQTEIIDKRITNSVKGIEITIMGHARVLLDTGEEIFDSAIEQENDEKLFLDYEQRNNLITAKDVLELRGNLGLSQRGFAAFTNLSRATIFQIENGSIPSKKTSDILKSFQEFDLEKYKQRFLESDQSKYSNKDFAKLNSLVNTKIERSLYKTALDVADWFVEQSLITFNSDEDTTPITQMKLHKLLYFAQRLFVQKNRKLLFNEDTLAFEHGPYYNSVGSKFHSQKELRDVTNPSDERKKDLRLHYNEISANSDVSGVLLEIWTKYGVYEASELRNMTHEPETAWDRSYSYITEKMHLEIPNEEIMNEEIFLNN